MTMNGAVLPVMAFFIVAGEEQGVASEQLTGKFYVSEFFMIIYQYTIASVYRLSLNNLLYDKRRYSYPSRHLTCHCRILVQYILNVLYFLLVITMLNTKSER